MPKVVDYPSRFDDIRRAVYEEILECGTRDLSLPRIAARMGLSLSTLKRLLPGSANLPHLALQAVQRKSQSRWMYLTVREGFDLEPWERAMNALLRELPLDEGSRDDLAVWRAALGASPRSETAVTAEAARIARLDEVVAALLQRSGDQDVAAAARLRLVVDGVVEAVATRRLTPTQAREQLEEEVGRLPGRPPAAGAA